MVRAGLATPAREYRGYKYDQMHAAMTEARSKKAGVWSAEGSSEDFDASAVTDYFGGATIAWSETLQRNVLVASYEIGRFGLMEDKRRQPDKVEAQRHYNSL